MLVRAVAASLMGPGFDEAYYHLFARNLAWGYYDHPPFVAWTAGLGYWLTGVWTPLTLRLGPILLFTIALAGFYTLAGRIYGLRAARLALILPHATPFFLVGAGAFVIPDNGLVAAWVWALVVAQDVRTGRLGRLTGFLLLGALTGVGMLAKYHAVLLPVSLLLTSLTDREVRGWWRDPRFYLAPVIALLVFLPCLLWNAHNDWISFVTQFGKGASGGLRIRFDLLGQAIGGQLGYLTPWMMTFLWVGTLRSTRKGRPGRWLLAFFLVPIVGMTLIGMTRGILPHWTMPGYIVAFVLMAGAWQHYSRIHILSAVAVVGNLLLVATVLLQANFGLFRLMPRSDPTLDPVGWRETIIELENRGELQEGDILLASRWFSAAELAWAVGEKYEVVYVGSRPHMFAWWTPEENYVGRSGVLIEQTRYGIDVPGVIVPRFAHAAPIDLPLLTSYKRRIDMSAWRVQELVHPQPAPYGPATAQ